MKKVIGKNSTRFYYEKGDVVIQLSTGKIIVVESVNAKNCEIIGVDGYTYKLTTDIRPSLGTKKSCKVIHSSNRGNISRVLKVLKYNDEMPNFNKTDIGDWIDVRVNDCVVCINDKSIIESKQKNKVKTIWSNEDGREIIRFKKGDVVILRLGFAMELPKGFEADLKPRSGTFKNTGLILTNSVGCVDESYKGNEDEWQMMYLATRDGEIERFERLGQFRINKKMDNIKFKYVEDLCNENRGGYSSTGRM